MNADYITERHGAVVAVDSSLPEGPGGDG